MNLYEHAVSEFELLEQNLDSDPDKHPIILEFKAEILSLVKRFADSGPSGGSAPFYASAVSRAIKDLFMFDPIGPLTGDDSEWVDTSEISGLSEGTLWQNKRLSSVFKDGNDPAHYLDAVVFQGESDYDRFSGHVDNVSSVWCIKSFPFRPKTFTIDVYRVPSETDPDRVSCREGDYLYHIKDPSQLEAVRDYYDEKISRISSIDSTSAVGAQVDAVCCPKTVKLD